MRNGDEKVWQGQIGTVDIRVCLWRLIKKVRLDFRFVFGGGAAALLSFFTWPLHAVTASWRKKKKQHETNDVERNCVKKFTISVAMYSCTLSCGIAEFEVKY